MKTISLIQNSQEWHAHRAAHFNASDAPAMLGCSPYTSRTELLDRLKTGISPEVDAGTQRRFDNGHRFEALALPLAQRIVGEELYPVTGTGEGNLSKLSASFDGLTVLGDTVFEHKTLNAALSYTPWDQGNGDHLPLHYRVQMEQQLLVSGAERVLFMASKWDGDTPVEERHCWYASDPALSQQIVSGWAQFERDLADHIPTVPVPTVQAAPVQALPALSVRIDGTLAVVSNLPAFGAALREFVARLPAQPSTDQEFADAEDGCKRLKAAEVALEAVQESALASMPDVETMRRMAGDLQAIARSVRLGLEKKVKTQKDTIRLEIVQEGREALVKYISELNAAMPVDYMPTVPADFAGVIRGLKSVDSIRNAVDTELARAKIEASEIANRIHINIKALQASGLVVHDAAALVQKAPDDCAAAIAQRLAAEKAREAAREEAMRERIRAEEAARLERDQAAVHLQLVADAEKEASLHRDGAPLSTAADPVPYRVLPMPVKFAEPDELTRLRGENAVLRDLLGECAAVLRAIDPDDSDEAEKLADLLGAIDRAQAPSRHQGALL